jgi:hypothetical protein
VFDGVTKKFEEMFTKVNNRIDVVCVSIEGLKKDIVLNITNINALIKDNLNKQMKDNDDINKKLVETKEEILKFIAKNSDKIDQLDAKSEKT